MPSNDALAHPASKVTLWQNYDSSIAVPNVPHHFLNGQENVLPVVHGTHWWKM